MALKLSR